MPTDDNCPTVYSVPTSAAGVSASPMPVSAEMVDFGRAPDDPANAQSQRVWTPPARRAAPVYEPTGKGDMADALAAGRTCSMCRGWDYENGQRHFQRTRLGQGIVRELAWKPEWWNALDYGLCRFNHREASHRDSGCENFVPKGRLVSFFGKLTAK